MYSEKNPYALNMARYSTHAIVIRNIGINKQVLDVGCNDGYIGRLADKTNEFYGLDYLPESVAKAKKVYKDVVTYDLNNLQSLPWDKRFDVIIFADVLEHLVDPEKTLQFFVDRYLAKDGIIIISLPNIANWLVRIKLLFGRFDYVDGSGIMDRTHFHLYTFSSALKLIDTAGLQAEQQLYGANLFGPIIRLTGRLLRNLLSTGIILVCRKKKS